MTTNPIHLPPSTREFNGPTIPNQSLGDNPLPERIPNLAALSIAGPTGDPLSARAAYMALVHLSELAEEIFEEADMTCGPYDRYPSSPWPSHVSRWLRAHGQLTQAQWAINYLAGIDRLITDLADGRLKVTTTAEAHALGVALARALDDFDDLDRNWLDLPEADSDTELVALAELLQDLPVAVEDADPVAWFNTLP